METMNVKDFYFDLPQELIAQDPLEDRSASRLLVLDKETGEVEHRVFKDILSYLKAGDCLVINDTKVIPARLFGEREGTQAKIEVLLLKRRENDIWETLVKPGKKAPKGKRVAPIKSLTAPTARAHRGPKRMPDRATARKEKLITTKVVLMERNRARMTWRATRRAQVTMILVFF